MAERDGFEPLEPLASIVRKGDRIETGYLGRRTPKKNSARPEKT